MIKMTKNALLFLSIPLISNPKLQLGECVRITTRNKVASKIRNNDAVRVDKAQLALAGIAAIGPQPGQRQRFPAGKADSGAAADDIIGPSPACPEGRVGIIPGTIRGRPRPQVSPVVDLVG
jgi:hypothetical protein